jgi:hypothetical protein
VIDATRNAVLNTGRVSRTSPTTMPVTRPSNMLTAWRPRVPGRPGARQTTAATAANTGCGWPRSW